MHEQIALREISFLAFSMALMSMDLSLSLGSLCSSSLKPEMSRTVLKTCIIAVQILNRLRSFSISAISSIFDLSKDSWVINLGGFLLVQVYRVDFGIGNFGKI